MGEDSSMVTWFFGSLITAVATMAAAIAAMWKVSESKNTKAIEGLEKRLDSADLRYAVLDKAKEECEHQRGILVATCDALKDRINRLENKVQ